MKRPVAMTSEVNEYLAYRRALGFRLEVEGRELLRFARYADSIEHRGPVNTDLALRWAQLPEGVSSLYRARRLEVVRCFARYQAIFHADTEIPPERLLGPAHRRPTPYIYSEEEILTLMHCTRALSPEGGLRPRTYTTLFGLLASTGLRISEALHIECEDFDSKQAVLRIRESKFHKSRLIPVHESTLLALQQYSRFRDAYHLSSRDSTFFLGENGQKLSYSTVRTTFRKIVHSLGWKTPRGKRPRLYDFRHTFICRTLFRWYRDGVDVNHAISSLSTYVGHVKPSDTYWYITGIPELMAVAAERFENFGDCRKEDHDET